MKISRRSDIAPFYVMEVMKAAARREAAGGEVLHLEVGQPSTPAPRGVLAAAEAALRSHRLGYTDAHGVPELRTRITRHYLDRYGVDVAEDRIAVTVGASGGFVLAVLAAFDEGDRVAMTEPGYSAYRNILRALGIEVVELPVGPDTRFNPTPDLLEPLLPLDGLVTASPSNPTGTILTGVELTDLAGFCETHEIRMIADEIYHGITYGDTPAPTVIAVADHAVVVQSFSKYFSMTGWRLGWLVLPEEMIRPVERLAQNLFISPPTLSQLAGIAAFDCSEELDANVARYAENRRILIGGLAGAGIDRIAPADGAFYVYADVSHLTDDSQALSAQWLDEIGVAATSGIDFDPTQGHRFIRFSYAESTADITEAAKRLVGWANLRNRSAAGP
ncbi:MAG: aminotransferase class I/II-fold pyridoxal phosphate-dependent enzyme [Acidimicrobiia bacterium]|nr:aminotransferase class I/II-fold pyridoxal phosphate-dependent enzyme [Acidimicrobiia bacterium]